MKIRHSGAGAPKKGLLERRNPLNSAHLSQASAGVAKTAVLPTLQGINKKVRNDAISPDLASLGAKRTWLFDLDNTLHNASPHIFPHINRSMTAYIGEHLGVDENEASRIRQAYWHKYGATMLGLMRHHDTDPRHFLWHTHQFPDLAGMMIVERGLKAMLQRLPGRKIIFSNAPLHYTESILAISGIRRCFDAVYSVERLRFQPKPAVAGFIHLLRNERLNPRTCIMVEDTLPNLKTAKRLGMKTVWVSTCTRQPPYADIKVSSVLDLPKRLGRL